MFRHPFLSFGLACILTLFLAAPVFTAQAQSGSVSVVASGLANARGFTWGPDGTLYVALAGTTGATAAEISGTPTGFAGGITASIVSVKNGCQTTVAGGLASATLSAFGWQFGVMDLAYLGGQLYYLEGAGGAIHGNADHPGGVYKLGGDGKSTLVADLETWVDKNPPAVLPPEGFPNGGSLFSMIAVGDALWISDAVNGQILSVTAAGAIKRLADVSKGHAVPTGLVAAPDGGAFLGFETSVPFPDGSAKVAHVAADGTVTDVWTGLTTVTGVALGPDGKLYAAEMATGNTTTAPYIKGGTGKVVKQTGPSSSVEVATGIDAPVAIHFGADGALYVSGPAFGANAAAGMVARLDISGGTPVAMTGALTSTPAACVTGTPAY